MRIKKDFEIVSLQDEYIAVPVGETHRDFRGVIKLNATGAFIWNTIRDGADTKEKILEKMMAAYEDLDTAVAEEDIGKFLKTAYMALEE